MSAKETVDKIIREFRLTTLALKNKNSIFLLSVAIISFGILAYKSMPKELTPEVTFPYIIVQTVYPGNPPVDIENLITRPLEKEIETVRGIKEMSSTSSQDYSLVFVEFNTDINLDKALQDTKDAVDRAKSELPNDLLEDPTVKDIDFSEFPIININLSGDFSIDALKEFAEFLEDKIETFSEISKVEIKGITEKEIKVNVDLHKLNALGLSFHNIEKAVSSENISMSGGELKFGKTKRSVRILGEFESVDEIRNIVIKNDKNKIVYLKDVARVVEGYEDPTSFARLDKKPVVSVQVIKKSGENLLAATNKIFALLDNAKRNNELPEDLNISITNDQSDMIRKQLSNLENSMVMGVIFVILVLFYFLGTRNSLFVGLAIPMSMFLSFIVMGISDYRINMIVLFALILALGLLVDNAIVVVENIHRYVERGYKPFEAARRAVGEIALPIITSTVTTLSAFLPLAFWSGIVGEFMEYLPLTLIIVLSSSLFIALVIIPVFAATFINPQKVINKTNGVNKKRNLRFVDVMTGLAAIFYVTKIFALANILMIISLLVAFNTFFLNRSQYWFQEVFLNKLENYYERLLNFSLRKRNPYKFFGGTVFLLIITIILLGLSRPNILFFPDNAPDYINIRAELPIGSDITATDSVMHIIEDDLEDLLKPHENIVESILTTVGEGAGEGFSSGPTPNLGMATITFVDYAERGGKNTSEIMKTISEKLIGKYPGIQISLEKNQMGPPTGNPVNLEISGKDFEELIILTGDIQDAIEKANIPGIEGLKMDLEIGKPEIIVSIDREKARRFGVSTLQIASTIRTSLFGKEISDYKINEDEYPIQLRLQDQYRYNISTLMNQLITYKKDGRTIQLPISAVADMKYSTTYGAVKRKDMNRVITLYSNVMEGYNANEINQQLKSLLATYDIPKGYNYKFTGEQEEQNESSAFLARAMAIAVALILIILVTQFNSLVKPLIIIASVVFSTIGVFAGIAAFGMDIVVIMTGVGIVSLAGIVVNNAIVLVDYIELLKKRKREELNIEEGGYLPVKEATACIVEAGKTRLRPVLLTAITTILGLLPLAVGLNIDFGEMLSNFDPGLYFGGTMVKFWGPIAWTIIYGLSISTFLTLIIVPVMYRISIIIQKKLLDLATKIKGNG